MLLHLAESDGPGEAELEAEKVVHALGERRGDLRLVVRHKAVEQKVVFAEIQKSTETSQKPKTTTNHNLTAIKMESKGGNCFIKQRL